MIQGNLDIDSSLQEKDSTHSSCIGCGPANDKGLKIKIKIKSRVRGDEVVADWTSQSHHEAFPGVLNGDRYLTRLPFKLDCRMGFDGAVRCKSTPLYSDIRLFGKALEADLFK